MSKELKVWTSRVDYSASGSEVVLNTTAKSANDLGKLFAPPWKLVMASKNGEIEWDEYCRRYLKLMRERYDEDRAAFHRICEAGEVVLLCYCRNTAMGSKRCHRYLLADVLVKVAIKKLGIDAKYMGERVNHSNQVTQERKRHAKRTRQLNR